MLLNFTLEDANLIIFYPLIQSQFLHFSEINFELYQNLLIGRLETIINIAIYGMQLERNLIIN